MVRLRCVMSVRIMKPSRIERRKNDKGEVVEMTTTTTMNTHNVHTKVKKHDWWTIVGGVCLAILGVAVMMVPGITLVTLGIIAGVLLAVAGVAEIVSYFVYKDTGLTSGWQIAGGVCNIVLAAIFLANPIMTAIMLPWLAGIMIAVYGVFSIVGGANLRQVMPSSWGWFIANGVIAIICALLFWLYPESFVIYLGIFFIFRGLTMVVFGWATKTTQVTYDLAGIGDDE